MVPIRIAGAAVALAILAVSAPVGRSDAADNQVTEVPDGLKYTDTKIGDGASAKAGNKVSVNYTVSPSNSRSAPSRSSPVGTRAWPA